MPQPRLRRGMTLKSKTQPHLRCGMMLYISLPLPMLFLPLGHFWQVQVDHSSLAPKRKEYLELMTTVPLLIIDDLGMRKLPLTAAEELLEIIMRRYERASTLITSNRPVDDWGKLLGDSAAVTAMLDRLLHHGHVLKCGPRSWRTKTGSLGRRTMTNAKAKAKPKAIWMPGKERPAASRLVIQRPPPTEPHPRNAGKNTKPSAGQPIRQTAEGLDYRFLRSQPRVIGPGSLRKARPRRSEYNLNTHPGRLENRP